MADKRILALQVEHETYERLVRLAQQRGLIFKNSGRANLSKVAREAVHEGLKSLGGVQHELRRDVD